MDGLAATSAAPAVQRSIDALPARGTAKILGIAEVSGIDVVLAIRNGTCQVSLLPDGLAEPTSTAPDSLGSQRPTVGGGFSDAHRDFPGSVLAGTYTQASAEMTPFTFVTVGCSEKAMAVRIEGARIPRRRGRSPVIRRDRGATAPTRCWPSEPPKRSIGPRRTPAPAPESVTFG
ncbi:hypothetical protein ACIOJE_28595 [Kitasatospora sp. NPDC087861]|uniref:hypothetical protein n=1 Tax=Kitasatospora sp. NPDC087861 TaxID=3364070 RepID=UPI0037FB10FD